MLSPEFRAVLLSYVEAKISTHDLETWLAPRMASLMSDPESDDASLLAATMLALAEMGDRIRTLAEVRSYLRDELSRLRLTRTHARRV